MDKKTRFVIDDLTGGRNGYLPPWAIAEHECVEAVNVDFYGSRCGRARGGTTSVSTAFVVGGPFTGKISKLIRHVPGTDEMAAELWAIDDAATPIVGRMPGAPGSMGQITLKDAITGNAWDVSAATCNGKLFFAYKSAVNRLHVWDGATIRRTGLAAPATPTVLDNGVDAYPSVGRYYRQRVTEQVAGVTVRRSEPSPATVNFVPIGTGLVARITRGAFPSEGETHWEVEASTDNVTFYRIATVVIGTTTYDDGVVTTSYQTNPLSARIGTYTLQKSYKYIAADQNRLLGFGSWTTTDRQDDVEFSAVVGSLDVGDTERVDTTTNYRVGLDENDSGAPTGLAGPADGAYIAFKYRSFYILTPTGQVALPFRVDVGSKTIGAIPNSPVIAEDTDGGPMLVWMSPHGPYKWSRKGMVYIGRSLEDILLRGGGSNIFLDSTKVVAHSLYFQDKRQVWMWAAIGVAIDDPQVLLVLDISTGAWTQFIHGTNSTALIEKARCACMFSDTPGAGTMTRSLKPYLGASDVVNKIIKADTGTEEMGFGGTFDSYLITRAYEVPGYNLSTGDVLLLGKSGATFTVRVFGDLEAIAFSDGTTFSMADGSVTIAATGPQGSARSRAQQRVTGTAVSEVAFVQYLIVIGAAIKELDRLIIPIVRQEALSA